MHENLFESASFWNDVGLCYSMQSRVQVQTHNTIDIERRPYEIITHTHHLISSEQPGNAMTVRADIKEMKKLNLSDNGDGA